MGTSLGTYELNHESAWLHGYRCFISIITRVYLLNVPNLPFGKRMLTGWRLAVPSIPPSGKEHTFSISHVLFLFSLIYMWTSSNNTRVQMFCFNYNTTVPLQCVALVVWKAYVDKSFGGLFLGIPIIFLPGAY